MAKSLPSIHSSHTPRSSIDTGITPPGSSSKTHDSLFVFAYTLYFLEDGFIQIPPNTALVVL